MRLYNSILSACTQKLQLFLVVVCFACGSTLFGQVAPKNNSISNGSEALKISENNITSVTSQIEFVSWFMGSSQPQFNNELKGNQNFQSKGITKKQILSLGISPNKVLYRTLLKKISSKDADIV